MADHTLRTYQRVHKFEHPTDVERGKISRDTNASIRKARQQDRLGAQLLANPLDEEASEQYAEAQHSAEKVRRDAKTHKKRLKQLEREGLR